MFVLIYASCLHAPTCVWSAGKPPQLGGFFPRRLPDRGARSLSQPVCRLSNNSHACASLAKLCLLTDACAHCRMAVFFVFPIFVMTTVVLRWVILFRRVAIKDHEVRCSNLVCFFVTAR